MAERLSSERQLVEAHQRHERGVLALVRHIGVMLVSDGHLAVWRSLYLDLRARKEALVCDIMMDALTVGLYEDGDEHRFLWGKDWRSGLADAQECAALNAKARQDAAEAQS